MPRRGVRRGYGSNSNTQRSATAISIRKSQRNGLPWIMNHGNNSTSRKIRAGELAEARRNLPHGSRPDGRPRDPENEACPRYSNDVTNEHSGTTIVAPITSKVRTPLSPLHVLLAADDATGLSAPSMALLNQIRTVDRHRLIKRLGAVNAQTMQLVNEAIEISLGLIDL